jgi:hypothetical protein
VFKRMRWARRGVRGGVQCPPQKKLFLGKHDTYLRKRVMYLGGFFGTWFFADGFLFTVKELGF